MSQEGNKILLLDVETSFKIAAVWGRYKQYVAMDQIVEDSYILNWSAKWLDDEYIYSDALYLHPKEYKKDATNDKAIMETLWTLVDEADYIIGHNLDSFDIPVINARMLANGIEPPSACKTIDTLKIARKNFKFSSNRLDDLGKLLNVGRKIETNFKLWYDVVIHQDKQQFGRMVAYCEQDVMLLEEVYNKLKPWHRTHPNLAILGDLEKPTCNVCGGDVIKYGLHHTDTQTYQKYRCTSCGHNQRSRTAAPKTKKQKENIHRSI